MLDKIKNISKMQGILYEKMKKKKTGKEEAAHPKTRAGRILYHLRKELGYEQSKFLIHPTRAFVTIPTPGETKIKSVMYPVIKPYAYANIRYNESENVFEYFVIEPRLNEHEEKILEKLKEGLIQIIDVSLADIKNPQKMIAFLEKGVQQLLTEYNFLLNEKEYVKIMYYIYRDFVGLNRIEAMMNDPYIEDIGCLPFDEKLFVREEGRIKLIQIGELIESQLADGIGIGSPKTKIEVLSFNPATMRAEYRNAIGLLRKNNRHGYYIDVKTEGGNHISVSPDHPMLVLSKDGIIVKRADSIKEGDYVLRLKNLSTDAQKVHIDLIDELSRINKNFRVKGANSLITSNLDVSKVLGISNRLVALWKRNNSMPIWAYLKLEKDSSLRKSLKVSPGQGVKNWIPAIIEPDEDFALFLGLFLAEGYYENAGISFAFGKHEKGLHDLTAGLSKKLFGVTTRIIEHKTSSVVYCGGKILKTLFNDILKIGNLSENKRVPEIAYSWDNDMLISLVNGYFLGDGYIRISDKTKKAVMATASKDLVLGIRYILYRLGIFTRVDKRDRRFANTWEISIERGRPLQKFAGEILKLHTEGGRASGTELYPSFLFNSGDYTGVQKKMVYSSTTRNGKLGINFALYSTNKMLQTLVAGDVHPVKIIDISTVKYTKPFYDIEVEGNKNFMHGDFIFTHNCDGLNVPIYAVHQKFGSIRTNVAYTSEQELREFVIKLAERSDRYISYAEPLLDGTLRDGSRVQASLAGDVTTRGPTFSIRKFKETPFTPVDMIRLNTVSDDLLAYLWFVVENGSNILITGGVSTGKTSILNTISLFIPSESKIVSIEDSVTGDAEIMVKRNGRIETMKIGSLIDRMIEKYGKEKTGNAEGIEVLTMNKDCKIEFQKPSAFIRHLVNKDIYEVTTSTGKKVKVTKDHSLFGLDDYGNVVAVKPEELEKIRFIATPRYIPVEGTEIKEMNLIEHLDKLKGEFLTGGPISKIFSIPYEEFKTLGISKNKYAWWKRKGIVSTDAFLRLSSSVAFTKDELNQIKIIGKTSSVPIPVVFPISDDFLNLLGLWIGDGSYDNRNKNKVIISNIDKECIETTHRFASSMNIKISLMHDNVSMSLNSTLLYKIMKNVIGLDGYADTKRIPAFIQNMSNRQVAEFLRGYFSADGSVKNYEISCSSQSLGLLNDIQTLLLRFGIISRISHYARKDRCRELSISSSENASKFRQIGFLQERKTLKMNMVASRHAHHTKTDVIPLGRNLAEEISRYEKLSFPYMTGMQNIGRQFLQGISEDCDSELIHRLAESDIFWDEVRDVRKAPAEPLYVYDLSVPENESFVCSNIVLHNTRELNLPHENWIPGVTRIGFAGSGLGEITMFELLRESFRQNPDYLVVGEVRGKEIYVMFQGMASGHPSISTMHAGGVDDVLKRLQTKPINLSPGLLDSLDIVLVMVHAREKGKSARRVKEVAEIESVDPSTGTPRINRPFVWLPSTDSFDYKGNSWMLNKISMAKGIPLNKIIKDISQRKKLLNWMYMKNITDIKEIVKYINLYRRNPDKIDQLISGTISESEL